MTMAADWALKARKLPGGRPGSRAIHRLGKEHNPPTSAVFTALNYPEFEIVARSIREAVLLDVYHVQYVTIRRWWGEGRLYRGSCCYVSVFVVAAHRLAWTASVSVATHTAH